MDRIFYDNQEYAKYSDKFLKRFNLADQAAYDALPAATKNDDSKVFFIPDIPEPDYLYKWDFTKSLTDEIQGLTSEARGNASFTVGTGVTIGSQGGYLYSNCIALKVGYTIEIDFSTCIKAFSNVHGRLITVHSVDDSGFIYRNQSQPKWEVYRQGRGWRTYTTAIQDSDIFSGKTLKMIFLENEMMKVYSDNILVYNGGSLLYNDADNERFNIGSRDGQNFYNMTITGVRIYENEEEE